MNIMEILSKCMKIDYNRKIINEVNKQKKKSTKSKKISFADVWASINLGFIKNDRYDILKKCQDLQTK